MTHPADRHDDRWYGKYAGLVTDVDIPEALGWIKVSVPTLYPDGEEMVARPCFAPGQFWVPPVGARVWIEFEAGDPACPLWVGIWYASGEVPEEAAIAPPTAHVWRTPGGHHVELADTDGAERIIVRHKDNAFVAIDEDGSIVLSSKSGATLYLNAADDEASLVSPQGHTVSMTDSAIGLVHGSGGVTVELKDGKLRLIADSIDIVGKSVSIPGAVGMGAGVAPLGVVLETIVTWLGTHIHGSAMGPTTPPLVPPVPSTFVSTKVKASL
jgi:hypothetical protein